MLKKLLVGLLLGASLLTTADAKIYSSRLWEERAPFCQKLAATAEEVAESGLTKPMLKNLQANPAVQRLSKQDQITLFDVVYLADQKRSHYWAFDYCMDRLET